MKTNSNSDGQSPKCSRNYLCSNFSFRLSAFDIFFFGFLIWSIGIVLGGLLFWIVTHFLMLVFIDIEYQKIGKPSVPYNRRLRVRGSPHQMNYEGILPSLAAESNAFRIHPGFDLSRPLCGGKNRPRFIR